MTEEVNITYKTEEEKYERLVRLIDEKLTKASIFQWNFFETLTKGEPQEMVEYIGAIEREFNRLIKDPNEITEKYYKNTNKK